MIYPLSKTLDPARDYAELAEELKIVDQHFHSAAEQHPHRRFEYAMALRAFDTWGGRGSSRCVDVGGAGSPFWQMLPVDNTRVIDPKENTDLATLLQQGHPPLADAVFCLSVLEHVEDLDQFCYHLGCLVAPGGLLFLTVDHCGCASHDADMEVSGTPDQHHFHWMRKRMFGQRDLRWLAKSLVDYQFHWLGERDFTLQPPSVYDYGFASLALQKRP